uniref:Uncharacterized protein n=1 Tax=Cannabis sativa TaxID=3483 RepID=A0A803P454_CANSA
MNLLFSASPHVAEIDEPHTAGRKFSKPSYVNEYHYYLASYNLTNSSQVSFVTTHPLSQVVGYHRLSLTFRPVVLAISSHFEPKFFSQAHGIPVWDDAMDTEIEALEKNHTWIIVSLPTGMADFNPVQAVQLHRAQPCTGPN